MRPKHTRRDLNHEEIRDGLRKLGAVVWDTADLGGKVLDLVAFWRGEVAVLEIKQPGLERILTEGERESIAALEMVGIEVHIVSSLEELLKEWPSPPHWQVVDQGTVGKLNETTAQLMEMAVELTKMRYRTPHQKERVCRLRDAIFEANDLWCETVEFF